MLTEEQKADLIKRHATTYRNRHVDTKALGFIESDLNALIADVEQAVRKEMEGEMDHPQVECEPQQPITEDGWTDWVSPRPEGYLMQCCDCKLIHEMQFKVVKYHSNTSEEYDDVGDRNMQAMLRARRYTKEIHDAAKGQT